MSRIMLINNNLELLKLLDGLEKRTHEYLDSEEKTAEAIAGTIVQLGQDLIFNEKMCREVGKRFKYFKGVFDGAGKSITLSSSKQIALFTSIYFSVIKNLTIKNTKGSKGMLLAYDINDTIIENVNLEGFVAIQKSTGGMTNTSRNVTYQECSINLEVGYRSSKSNIIEDSHVPVHYGSFAAIELGGSKYLDCSVSGRIDSDVSVGGFIAIARDAIFKGCNITELEVMGNREVSYFVGTGSGHLDFQDCVVTNSSAGASYYLGNFVGKTTGTVYVENVTVVSSNLIPVNILSFVGGIAGSALSIKVVGSFFEGTITAHFVIAGITPDATIVEVLNSEFSLEVVAIGYSPMMTHVYEMSRTDYLTSTKQTPILREKGNRKKIRIQELGMGGTLNPFEESVL